MASSKSGERCGAICFVANDFNYIVRNGGIGTYFWLNAHLLAAHGWKVHVLYGNPYVEDEDAVGYVKRRLAKVGITFTTLDDHDPPAHHKTYMVDNWNHVSRSEIIRAALEQLHARHRFDLIEFCEWGGCGFRSVQAKRAGLAFHDVQLLVKMHSSTQWNREGNHQWLHGIEDLRNDYMERYAFENADLQGSPSHYMFDYARSVHWNVRPDAIVLGNAYPERPAPLRDPGLDSVEEIVFFGRLEPRKGLEIFLEACEKLPQDVRLTFVGKDTMLHGGRMASVVIPERLEGRTITLHMKFNQEQALEYLRGEGRLAVIPSLMDNYPYTVVECATQGIPFIASSVGGIPEILSDPVARKNLLFQANAKDLARCMLGCLEASAVQRRLWYSRVSACTDPDSYNSRLVESYQALRRWAEPPKPLPMDGDPLVTLAVSHYNLGAYLPETLKSLTRQTYRNLDVIVIDDGSTDAESQRVFEEQKARYPKFRFVSKENGGCGAARNHALRLARGEFFVPIDADNLAAPHMVETFVKAMRHNTDAVAMTCYFYAFVDGVDPKDEEYLYCFNPLGGPHAYACFENVYGDTNAIFRTATFREQGGFEEDRSVTGWEDWITYTRLINAGQRVGVIPAPLFYYRVREAGQLKQTNGWSREYALTQKLLGKCFPPEILQEPWDQSALWTTMVSFRHIVGYLNYRVKEMEGENREMHERMRSVRYRVVDKMDALLKRIPLVRRGLKGVFKLGWKTLKGVKNLLMRRRVEEPAAVARPAAGSAKVGPEKKAA